jgi:hypothetical protein
MGQKQPGLLAVPFRQKGLDYPFLLFALLSAMRANSLNPSRHHGVIYKPTAPYTHDQHYPEQVAKRELGEFHGIVCTAQAIAAAMTDKPAHATTMAMSL